MSTAVSSRMDPTCALEPLNSSRVECWKENGRLVPQSVHRLRSMQATAFVVLLVTAAVGAASEPRAVVPGAVRFGALFAVHGAPAAARAGARCGAVREHYGIQRVEATLQALDAINADRSLTAGVRLGAELRDSCWAPPTALRQTIELVRDAIAPPDISQSITRRELQILALRTPDWLLYRGRAGRRALHHLPRATHVDHVSWHSVLEPNTGTESARAVPLLGVLGPGASSAAVQVQNLLQLFSIPQISYSATSRELSDRARFSTFFRVVPSDRHQARALVALLRAHNWTYVHAVHTDESYGQSGMATFREEAALGGVCVAREEPLRAAPAPREVDAVLARLAAEGESGAASRVCVCWCEGRTARALLAGMTRAQLAGRAPLRLLASDGWADRRDVVHGLEPAAQGSLTLRIRSPYLANFDTYYHALSPLTNVRNPWFREFWEQKFNCSLEETPPEGVHRCSGMESLVTNYTQEPKLALVVRGVYALAHALRDMRRALCGPTAAVEPGQGEGVGLCPAMLPFNVSLYRQHLARVRFRSPDGGLVAFDENGDPPAELSEYDVMSFEGEETSGWRYERVGRWRQGVLRLRGGSAAAYRRARDVHATCSAPCEVGQWARAGEGRARCCWTCVSCPALAITVSPPAAGCRHCPPGHRPDLGRKTCLPSPIEWGGGGRSARAVSACAGAAGTIIAIVCAVTLWRHRTTPVVKSASRELCALLLCAAVVCHGAALAAATRPSAGPCATVRLAAPALGGVYAAVVARTVRVARLVAAVERQPTIRPRLLSSRAQVWAWAALSAPGGAMAAWSAVQWPPTVRVLHPGRARSVLACGGEAATAQLVPLAPALLLLGACVVLAIRTRRLPHNFNETRFVGAAAYATCVTWVAFFPLYAVTEARTATLCACVSLSAGACVALSLGPRVWVCVCRPERNTRAHFLTTTSIRCHLGKYRPETGPRDHTLITLRRDPQPYGCDVGCQTSASALVARERCIGEAGGTRVEGGACAAVGACARISRAPIGGGGEGEEHEEGMAHVLIVLLHHYHTEPAELARLSRHQDI